MRETKGEKIFHIVNNIFMILVAFICIYPMVYVISASFSSMRALDAGEVVLLPKGFNIGAYKAVFEESDIWVGYGNTIFYTIIGTIFSLFLTVCGAYPLSKKKFPGKGLVTTMLVFSMWFGAGLVPNYLNYVELGLLNTRTAIILNGACSGMYVVIMRTFFQSVPDSLEEAALIDGANQIQILIKIYLPLSLAAFATVGLMYALARWNGYIWSMILLKDESLQPLSVILKRLVVDNTFSAGEAAAQDTIQDYSTKMLTYAIMVVSTVPMLLAYPFIQKYFEKGMMVGAVKG